MPSIGSVFVFAAGAAAQLTTSVWLPGGSLYYDRYGYSGSGFISNINASIIAKDGDRTTMAINAVPESATFGAYKYSTQTVTFIGTTSFESVSVYDYRVGYETTTSMGCSLAESTKVLCTSATYGPAMYSRYCSYYTESTTTTRNPTTTRRYTYTNPPQTVTQVYTDLDDYYDYYSRSVPSFCKSGSELPESVYKTAMTVRPETYQVIVTAAAEKLTATGGPTPTSSGASGSNASSGASGSGGAQNTNAPDPSGTGTSQAPPANNAAPMITLSPVIAGLGAAAAYFL